MAKKLVRLYPQDIERMEWVAAADGGRERVVASDGDGSVTRFHRLDAGERRAARPEERWHEVFVLEGSFEEDGVRYEAGSYLCLPPGARRGEVTSAEGVLSIEALDHHDRLDKPERRLTAAEVEALPWQAAESGQPGFREKFLARDERGSLTRLLDVGLDGNTVELDDHDHDEEVLIVRGACRNGEELHPAGTYTFNPPHAVHGPFDIYEPLLCYEIKNVPRSEDLR
ncbi:cupin domain-containing protein [Conexibacter arvalis]|uniref:ChrR-like cupin domain-containing protein n=1 Tax=Conexibacter arvalis TaxID=912552 RepID=A0A840IAW9_9ACTN|nr:cupin domain-containing protein [Conexibacter arvalis]MBB4661401.1 hypothetical protein [Conexibacter arvalis]